MKLAWALLVMASSAAHADDDCDEDPWQTTSLADISPDQTPCDAMHALEEGPSADSKCTKVASRKIKGVGRVAAYALNDREGGNWHRYALVITAADGSRVISPWLDYVDSCGMAGRCSYVGKVRAKLRTIRIDGQPAAALEVRVAHKGTYGDWRERSFLVCNAEQCATADLGGPSMACKATLGDDGVLTHACDVETEVPL